MSRKQIPSEALVQLRSRLELLPERSRERRALIEEASANYGVSVDTLYRSLRRQQKPKAIQRSDKGKPRKLTRSEMENYCEVIAAMKIRTNNSKGRHLSTVRAIELLEEYGIETPDGFIQPPKELLKKSTVNYYLKNYSHEPSWSSQTLLKFCYKPKSQT